MPRIYVHARKIMQRVIASICGHLNPLNPSVCMHTSMYHKVPCAHDSEAERIMEFYSGPTNLPSFPLCSSFSVSFSSEQQSSSWLFHEYHDGLNKSHGIYESALGLQSWCRCDGTRLYRAHSNLRGPCWDTDTEHGTTPHSAA